MRLLNSLAIAISMYSKIPVPMVDWNEKNMKYAMCFFPVVGVITGIIAGGSRISVPAVYVFRKAVFRGGDDTDSCSCYRRDPSGRICGYHRCAQFPTGTGKRNCRYSKTRIREHSL